MVYFGTRLSENLSRREPEGYLICLNVPVARTGVQEYLPSELGLPGPDDRMVPVRRPEEEVFAPACMASFEGMPVTDGHPEEAEGVTAENAARLQKGHAHHVRRGAGADRDLLLADLIITDGKLAREILGGKREISCGYNYVLSEEDGGYVQREIRGNHVAVVDAGRAGPRVSIRDREPGTGNETKGERIMKRKSMWRARMMARMAKDGDTEGLAEMISEVMEAAEEAAAETAPAGAVAVGYPMEPGPLELPETADEEAGTEEKACTDCGPEILAALREIIGILSAGKPAGDEVPGEASEEVLAAAAAVPEGAAGEPAAEAVAVAAEAPAEAPAETAEMAARAATEALEAASEAAGDPVEGLVAGILEGDEAEPEDEDGNGTDEDPEAGEEIYSRILEPERKPEEDARTADALRAALGPFRAHLRQMTPAERRRFTVQVMDKMKKVSGNGKGSGAYASLSRGTGRDADSRELGKRIMESRNVNLRHGA